MSKLKTVPCDADLRTIAKKMLDEKVSSFQVIKEGSVVGTVSYEHLLRALIDLLDHPEKHGLTERIRELFYTTPVGEIINTLAQAGI